MNAEAEARGFGCGLIVGTVIATIAMFFALSMKYVHETDVIEHGAGYYHPETGEFTWKENPKENP